MQIKLKALIEQASTSLENLDPYIKLEVQFTQVEQEEQVEEEIIDVAVEEQEQARLDAADQAARIRQTGGR